MKISVLTLLVLVVVVLSVFAILERQRTINTAQAVAAKQLSSLIVKYHDAKRAEEKACQFNSEPCDAARKAKAGVYWALKDAGFDPMVLSLACQ